MRISQSEPWFILDTNLLLNENHTKNRTEFTFTQYPGGYTFHSKHVYIYPCVSAIWTTTCTFGGCAIWKQTVERLDIPVRRHSKSYTVCRVDPKGICEHEELQLWRCGMHGHPHRSLWSAIDQQWLLSSSCGSWDLRICKGRGDSHTLSLQNPLIWLYIIHPHNFVCRCTWIGSHLQTKCANVIREKRPLVSSLYEPVDRVWEITSWS